MTLHYSENFFGFYLNNNHLVFPISHMVSHRIRVTQTTNIGLKNAFTSASGTRRPLWSFSNILPKWVVRSLSLKAWICYLKIFYCRIPKFPRWKNSDDLLSRLQILRPVYKFLLFLFGGIVEMSWIQCGQTSILVRLLIIYLARFSFQVPQNKGKQCYSIFLSFNSHQWHHQLIRYLSATGGLR